MDYIPSQKTLEALLIKAEGYRKQGHFDGAITEFKKALMSNPKSLEAQIGLGQSYEGKGTSEKEPTFWVLAQTAYEKALNQDPNRLDIHQALIGLSFKQGRVDDLLKLYRARSKTDAASPVLQDCLKQLQAMSLASIPQHLDLEHKRGGCLAVVLDVGLPLIGVTLVLLGTMTEKIKGIPTKSFMPLGVLLLLIFIGFKLATRKPAAKKEHW